MLTPVCLSFGTTLGLAQSSEKPWERKHIQHVLVISIDGMHSVDYLNCAYGMDAVNDAAPYCPNIAALGETGIDYRDAYTSKPSDSFPGLTAVVTGGSPKTEGIYYDVAYDRSLDPPRKTTTVSRRVFAAPAQIRSARKLSMRKASTAISRS